MHNIIIEKPYKFIPPYESRFWRPLLQRYLPRHLRRTYGVVEVECRGVEHLAASIDAGHGILLTPNHCHPADPFVLGTLSKAVGKPFFFMASWHVFMQDWLTTFIARRMGAFSVYREGLDKWAIGAAVDILDSGRRPLVIFPEGVITRTNDQLVSLMEGTSFIARRAAKKRARDGDAGKVVIHPVAVRYYFLGDLRAAIDPVLSDLEHRLTWRPQTDLPIRERVVKLGVALLGLKEVEYLGMSNSGTLAERMAKLIDGLLEPVEQEWCQGERPVDIVGRVKKVRVAMLPDMVNGKIDEEERTRRWRQLAALYLAQQISCYTSNYIQRRPTVDRVLETIERFEEDVTEKARVHAPRRCVIQVAEPIEVPIGRQPRGEADPIMVQIEQSLNRMLEKLGEQATMARAV